MTKLHTASVLLASSFLLALLPVRSSAQSDVGSITGFVRDPSQATVPGAKIVVKNELPATSIPLPPMDVNTWGRNLSTTTNFASPFRYNDFGFDLGGPVAIPGKWDRWRNKFFWFVAEEWTRHRFEDTQSQAVPTTLMRQGDFSELLSPNPWYKMGSQLYFPNTCPKPGAVSCRPFQETRVRPVF